jgi:hypothetical protein
VARHKMLILPGNSAEAGTYPDDLGNKIAWPTGALHAYRAETYAKLKGYKPVRLNISGSPPRTDDSPQISAALEKFLGDERVAAFYGFSGGGYNVKHILVNLATKHPETLYRIWLVVVLGAAPDNDKREYYASNYVKPGQESYDRLVKLKKIDPAKDPYLRPNWDLVWKDNPEKEALWKDLWEDLRKRRQLPKKTDSHMFGPDVLLDETHADPNIPAGDADDDLTEVIEKKK